eukprot:503158-Prymnesium_polylepis.1
MPAVTTGRRPHRSIALLHSRPHSTRGEATARTRGDDSREATRFELRPRRTVSARVCSARCSRSWSMAAASCSLYCSSEQYRSSVATSRCCSPSSRLGRVFITSVARRGINRSVASPVPGPSRRPLSPGSLPLPAPLRSARSPSKRRACGATRKPRPR